MQVNVYTNMRKLKILISVILLLMGYHLLQNTVMRGSAKRWIGNFLSSNGSNDTFDTKTLGLLIDTPGCKLADIDPFHPILKYYYKKMPPRENKPDIFTNLIYLDDQKIYLNHTAKHLVLKKYKAEKKKEDLTCCVSYIKIFSLEKNDSTIRFPDGCEYFTDAINITDEYMSIKCYVGKKHVFEKLDVKIMRKSNVEARCKNILKNADIKGTRCKDQLSVMIFGIDSVSRLNFQRQLPETRKILLEELGAIELLGYNKAGEYTYMCLMPLLSGMTAQELEKQCGGGDYKTFDNCRFIWDVFAAAGYRTAYAENMNYFGLFTNRKRKGFRRQPVDYYGRTFYNVLEMSRGYSITKKFRNVSNDEALFQWALEFHKEFHDDLHFGHFWISLFSHDKINQLQYVEPFLSGILRTLKDENLMNTTLIIILSDHGMRMGSIRSTDLGRLEDKLPAAYFVFPEWFKQKHPEAMRNFKCNAQNRLVTAFDIHKTFEDIAHCKIPATSEPSVHRGTNLFSNISPLRTCSDVSIEDIFCSCRRKEFYLAVNSSQATKVSSLLYKEVASIAEKRKDVCEELKLHNVTMVKAETEIEESFIAKENKRVSYTVILSTKPGDGLFEGTVHYDGERNIYSVNPTIRRINMFGTTSACVNGDPLLTPICYCKKQI